MALSIPKEQFLQIYGGTRVAQYADLFYSEPATDLELANVYLPSKLWRLNNCYTIVNKYGERIRFRMNLSQHKVYAESLRHPRIIILKSRQQGISTLWLVSFFDDAVCNPNFSIGLMAQGQDESETLLERVKILWDELDANVKSHLGIAIKKDNTKEFSIAHGHQASTVFIRTSFRSATLQRLHVSEMGKIANKYPEKAQETKTGTLQAIAPSNTAVIESTAEGDNLFKEMWDNAMKRGGTLSSKDFRPVFLSWLYDPDCTEEVDQPISKKVSEYFAEVEKALGVTLTRQQKNFWVMQYRELGDKIYQEYPTTPDEAFMATREGTYYAKQYLELVKNAGREQQGLYDPNLDVQVAFDLGMDDTNVGVVFQTYRSGADRQYRIIDELADNGKMIKYYTDELKSKPYADRIAHIILPPDAEVNELTSGKTRTQVFQEEMPKAVVTVLPKTDRMDGIDQVRQMIGRLWVDPQCEYLIDCFYGYHKEWNEKKETWRRTPDHDEHSNGADAVRYMVQGAMLKDPAPRPKQRSAGHDV